MLFTSQALELLIEMSKKEIKTRYKNTFFGFIWLFANPLLQAVVISFVFGRLVKSPVENYFLFLLSGLFVWNFFSQSLSKATSSIVNERSLIKKSNFAKEIIPASIIISNFINLVASSLILTLVAYFNNGLIIEKALLLLAGSISLYVFTYGLSLITSSLNVRYRDISFFVQAALVLWFYITPIIYSIRLFPQSYQFAWGLNPLSFPVVAFQSFFSGYGELDNQIILGNLLISIFTLISGMWIFYNESKKFDDWI